MFLFVVLSTLWSVQGRMTQKSRRNRKGAVKQEQVRHHRKSSSQSSACVSRNQPAHALETFHAMQRQEDYAYDDLINAFEKENHLHQPLEIVEAVQRQGAVSDILAYNALASECHKLKVVRSLLDGVFQAIRDNECEELGDALAQQESVLHQCRNMALQLTKVPGAPSIVRKSGFFLQGYATFLLGDMDNMNRAGDLVYNSTFDMCDILGFSPADRMYFLAQIYLLTGDRPAVEQSLLRTLNLNPRHLSAYIDLVEILSESGDMASAYRLAKDACTLQPPLYWSCPWQRPAIFISGLLAQPWWDSSSFEWALTLERNADVILKELRNLEEASKSKKDGFLDVGTTWENDRLSATLLDGGRWREFVLLEGDDEIGKQAARNRAKCPKTVKLLNSIPAIHELAAAGLGEALFSRIAPGTHLKPHCGETNVRLTCHLCLTAPDPEAYTSNTTVDTDTQSGCMIRVGPTWRQWEKGRCLFFDDSFEHEVAYRCGDAKGGREPDRVVLLMRFWHPSVPPDHWEQGRENILKALVKRDVSQLVPCNMEHFKAEIGTQK